ncbi:neprilysin-2-like isoform X2 [Photinus pyralis]|uniref:neprilysin-2-like isoform X2 n=1 Tax=Photinus pyralis TaxID=7054 RepID=UPI0012677A0D|nr:neprilysin-2-like isoform X2 [Photinus pyralis]
MKKSIFASRTKSEIILITVVIALTIITLTLIILLARSRASDALGQQEEVRGCRNQTCITEALEILRRVNVDVNPCENFHAFSCGNVEPLSDKHLKYGPFTDMVKNFRTRLKKKFSEEILPSDHVLVQTEKRLFSACMNETMEYVSFKTLRDALIFAGGWPVVEGNKWNEVNFDWIQATFTLRQMGYLHSTFLQLDIVEDPKKNDGYIFQVSIPAVDDVYSKHFSTEETNGFMADVAIAFGAEIHRALGEMTQALEFLLDLQWIRTNIEEIQDEYQRITVDQLQKKHGSLDWLNYINQITRTTPKITGETYILFPSETSMDQWLSTVMKAPKRLQANYLMWRVVEDNLPFVTSKLRSEKIKPKFMLEEEQTRAEFCIDILRENFSPSPIDVLYVREILPQGKVDQINQLLGYFKEELMLLLDNITWLNDDETATAREKIEEVSISFRAPDEHVFLGMKYNVSSGDFITMLSQLKKDNLDYLYGLLRESPKDTKLAWWKMTGDSSFHLMAKNEIEISPTILQGFIFNENRPNYLNYATMGMALKNILYKLLGGSTEWANKVACNLKEGIPNFLYHALTHLISAKVSYSAYKRWVKDHGEELKLYPLDYTPEQLFWMSPGEIYCHYTDSIFNSELQNGTYNNVLKEVLNNNPQMLEDFKCGFYIENKCTLY